MRKIVPTLIPLKTHSAQSAAAKLAVGIVMGLCFLSALNTIMRFDLKTRIVTTVKYAFLEALDKASNVLKGIVGEVKRNYGHPAMIQAYLATKEVNQQAISA